VRVDAIAGSEEVPGVGGRKKKGLDDRVGRLRGDVASATGVPEEPPGRPWIPGHRGEDLSVAALSARACPSERSIAGAFLGEVGQTRPSTSRHCPSSASAPYWRMAPNRIAGGRRPGHWASPASAPGVSPTRGR